MRRRFITATQFGGDGSEDAVYGDGQISGPAGHVSGETTISLGNDTDFVDFFGSTFAAFKLAMGNDLVQAVGAFNTTGFAID